MANTSLFDMIALAFAVLLAMKQLSFSRPEIDSYKEVIHLPAQEKNTAIVLFAFSLFKMIYQFYWYLPDDYDLFDSTKKVASFYMTNVANRGFFMTQKKMSKGSFLQSSNWNNVCLVISSLICLISSCTFKFEMRNAEKRMTLKIIRVLTYISSILFVMILLYVTFIENNKCICIIFLLISLFDILRIVQLLLYGKKQGQRVEITDYLLSLKWFTYSVMIMLIFGSFFYCKLRDYFGSMPTELNSSNEAIFKNAEPFFRFLDWFTLYMKSGAVVQNFVAYSLTKADRCNSLDATPLHSYS